MSFFKKTYCPVCNEKITILNKSNAKFNNLPICVSCIDKINKARGGEIEGTVSLENLQSIVRGKQVTTSNSLFNDSCFDSNLEEYLALENKFSQIISLHYSLLEKVDMLYSTAINMPDIKNKATEKCIELCIEDISLAEDFKDYCINKNKLNGIQEDLPHYSSFYYLTQLYTKLGKLDDAIIVCKKAVDLGYYRDNSKGGMPSRLARLLKKKQKLESLSKK